MNPKNCNLCPRNCGVNRFETTGFCNSKDKILLSWYGKHFGEEPVISGRNGSGTIFFCNCNLRCVYCQNWQISQECVNCKEYTSEQLSKIFLELQKKGVHNINLVSPTTWTFWIKESLILAKKRGLKIPVIWNSNAYEKQEILKEMEGLVDIYLPDYKYAEKNLAIRYSAAPNYTYFAKRAILEMYRQVGDLIIKSGLAQRGLIIRHLVLPNNFPNTKKCLEFIRSVSPNIHLSLMSQYTPLYKANNFQEINQIVSFSEWQRVCQLVKNLNFKYGWVQEYKTSASYIPDFRKEKPFDFQN